jgi:hypothetical protein
MSACHAEAFGVTPAGRFPNEFFMVFKYDRALHSFRDR